MHAQHLTRQQCLGRTLGAVAPRPAAAAAALFKGGAARHSQHSQRSSSIQAAAAGVDINHAYTNTDAKMLEPYVGPVKAVRLKVGLGLEASKTLAVGETLIISTPLALVSHSAEAVAAAAAAAAADIGDGGPGDEGWCYEPTDADIDALAAQLGSSSSSDARTQAWLQYLDDGSLDPQRTSLLPDLHTLAAAAAAAAAGSSSSSSSSSPNTYTVPAAPAAAAMSEDMLLDITDLNARVMTEDERLLSLGSAGFSDKQQQPKTLVGIWPELGLLQHSCSPNTSVVVHKSCAVVTSSRAIPKQAGLHQNLLGPGGLLLSPLRQRRAALLAATGVKCMCPRCRDEEKQDRNLQQLVSDIYEACTQQIGPELEAAVEADDDDSLEGLKDQLAAYCEVVDAGFSKLAVKQQSQIWLQASLFKLYELTAIAAAACGTVDARLLELLAALAAEVSPGCDAHLFWAQQYRAEIASDEDSYFDGALRQAEAMCYSAYQARYGRSINRELYSQLQQHGQEELGEEDK